MTTKGQDCYTGVKSADNRAAAFITLWRGLCGGRDMPCRADVTAIALGPLLPDCVLLDLADPSTVRMRVVGSSLTDVFEMVLCAVPLTTLFCARGRDRLANALSTLRDRPAHLSARVGITCARRRLTVAGRLEVLPLTDWHDEQTLALAGLFLPPHIKGIVGSVQITDLRVTPLTTNQRLQGCAEPATPYRPKRKTGPGRRPDLHLVHPRP